MDTGCYGTRKELALTFNAICRTRSSTALSTRYAKYTSTMYSYTAHPTQSFSLIHDECSSAFALRRSLSTPGKPNLGRIRRHLVSATGKRLKALDFPQPSTQKKMLQFIGYVRDDESLARHENPYETGKLIWTRKDSAAFKLCQQAISNCQEFYFLEDITTPILQTDASDYGIGGYLYMATNGKVRVIRFYQGNRVLMDLLWC